MTDAHEIVTLTPRRGIGSLGEGWTSAKIECSACPYVRFTGAPHHRYTIHRCPCGATEKRTFD